MAKKYSELKDACWKGYEAIGTKKKNGKTVPNCVPKEEAKLSEDYWNVVYKDKSGKVQAEKDFDNEAAAKKYADRGNSIDKVGGKYHVFKVRGMREESEMDMDEQAPVAPTLDRKYIKGTPEHKAYMATKKPRTGHPTNEEVEIGEGMQQKLRKYVPGYAKKQIDKKMDDAKFGKTDVDKDANFYRYKKVQDKLKKEEVELEEAANVKAIQKAVDDGKSMDAIMSMFANKRTTNTDEIRKVVRDYMWKKRMKKEDLDEVLEGKDPNEYDKEGDMAKNQLKTICRNAEDLMKMMGDDDNLPEWVQSKITKAEDYISSVRDYLQSEKETVKESAELKEMKRKVSVTKNGKTRTIWDAELRTYKQMGWELVKEEADLQESHFKVGQRVKCVDSGMEGEVVKKDPEEKGKYYTVKTDAGKTMKYSPDELKALKEEKMSDDEMGERERIVKGMKKSFKDFVKKYGSEKKAKEVMYATATKMAKDK